MGMNLEDVRKKYYDMEYTNVMVYPKLIKTLKRDTIIDEEKSVKWNKEELIRINEETIRSNKEKSTAYYTEQLRLQTELLNDIETALIEEFPKMNTEQIHKVVSFVKVEHDDEIINSLEYMESHCELFMDLLMMENH
jgi:hypothetical protein